MKPHRALSLLLLMVGASASPASDVVQYKDSKAGFELSYPRGWEMWKDADPDNHLTLRSSDDNLMVFVNSSVLDESKLPQTESVLADWARSIYDHGDPTVQIESCTVVTLAAGRCVKTVLIMSPKGGQELHCENYTFVEYDRNRLHRRIWKVFAIFPKDHLTSEERRGWQHLVATVRIQNYE